MRTGDSEARPFLGSADVDEYKGKAGEGIRELKVMQSNEGKTRDQFVLDAETASQALGTQVKTREYQIRQLSNDQRKVEKALMKLPMKAEKELRKSIKKRKKELSKTADKMQEAWMAVEEKVDPLLTEIKSEANSAR